MIFKCLKSVKVKNDGHLGKKKIYIPVYTLKVQNIFNIRFDTNLSYRYKIQETSNIKTKPIIKSITLSLFAAKQF